MIILIGKPCQPPIIHYPRVVRLFQVVVSEPGKVIIPCIVVVVDPTNLRQTNIGHLPLDEIKSGLFGVVHPVLLPVQLSIVSLTRYIDCTGPRPVVDLWIGMFKEFALRLDQRSVSKSWIEGHQPACPTVDLIMVVPMSGLPSFKLHPLNCHIVGEINSSVSI